MTLAEPAEDRAFREEVRAFLRANLPADWPALTLRQRYPAEPERVAYLRDFQRRAHEAGLVGITWPTEYGGRGGTLRQQAIWAEEMARAKAPPMLAVFGLTMVGPTLMQFGTETQRRRFIPKILSAEEIWCQGYSEPNAGSDLASLQTSAVEDGDDFVVNGSKIWNTHAHFADWIFLLARTDPAAPKHKGISYLLCDLRSPGITIRPIRQITGEGEFNQTFFDNVRIPKANLVGEKNKGWLVAVATLSFERAGLGETLPLEQRLDDLIALAKQARRNGGAAWDDPLLRQKLAEVRIQIKLLERLGLQLLATQMRGEIPGPEASLGKLFGTELERRLGELALEIVGPYALLDRGPHALVDGEYLYEYLWTRRVTIYGGSSEIQRNIIGERALGLPKG